MITVRDILNYLEVIAPPEMKMDIDNIGLLAGRGGDKVSSVLLSLDITSGVIEEAERLGAELVVSHHPLFFSLKSVTDGDITGAKLIKLLRSGISAICMHTNLDAARLGVNDALASAAGIAEYGESFAELLAVEGTLSSGEVYSYGRVGFLKNPVTLDTFLQTLKKALNADGLRYYDAGLPVHKIAVVGGSGGGDMHHAVTQGCDTFVTADIKYDVFLDAMEQGINLIDGGHFCTENLVIARLARRLHENFPELIVAVSATHGQIIKFYS